VVVGVGVVVAVVVGGVVVGDDVGDVVAVAVVVGEVVPGVELPLSPPSDLDPSPQPTTSRITRHRIFDSQTNGAS
jgi:hypothetical protein